MSTRHESHPGAAPRRVFALLAAAAGALLLAGCQAPAAPANTPAPPPAVTETVVVSDPAEPADTTPEETGNDTGDTGSESGEGYDQATVVINVAERFFAAADTSDWEAMGDLVLDAELVTRLQNNDEIRATLAEYPDADVFCYHRDDADAPQNLVDVMVDFESEYACTRTVEQTVYDGRWAAPTVFLTVDPAGEAWFVNNSATHWE